MSEFFGVPRSRTQLSRRRALVLGLGEPQHDRVAAGVAGSRHALYDQGEVGIGEDSGDACGDDEAQDLTQGFFARMILEGRIKDGDDVKVTVEGSSLALNGMPTTLIGKAKGMN